MKDSTLLSNQFRDLAIGLLALFLSVLIWATIGIPVAV